ncbi:unnamed protein product [Phytophthora fragariaefolia]|uniref:Unnamed protein product n=1 Tax=Phytophthora fragariaefolia TaxID=1490495 RepID=A0A9W6X2B9_9STRA|nr:unnamed protein product [Phytophthora fragariaefolia]
MNKNQDLCIRQSPTKRQKVRSKAFFSSGWELRDTLSDGSSSDDAGGMTDVLSSQDDGLRAEALSGVGSAGSPLNRDETESWARAEPTTEIQKTSLKLHERKEVG